MSPFIVRLSQLLVAIFVLQSASCTFQTAAIPSAADLDRYHEKYRAIAQPHFDELERQRASGQLTQAAYEMEKESLEGRVQQQAVDAAYSAHQLAQSDRRAHDLPTADRRQDIPNAQGSASGSFYQSHNDRYGGSSMGAGGAMSRSSGSSGSILGGL